MGKQLELKDEALVGTTASLMRSEPDGLERGVRFILHLLPISILARLDLTTCVESCVTSVHACFTLLDVGLQLLDLGGYGVHEDDFLVREGL